MADKQRYPSGLYSTSQQQEKLPSERYQLRIENREQLEVELPANEILVIQSCVVFLNGILISQSEYTISDNIITFNQPLKKDDLLVIMK